MDYVDIKKNLNKKVQCNCGISLLKEKLHRGEISQSQIVEVVYPIMYDEGDYVFSGDGNILDVVNDSESFLFCRECGERIELV